MSMMARDPGPAPTLVARFAYRHEGELARGYLEDAGIAAMLLVDDASGIEAGMTFVNPARLMVREHDAERAREVLRAAGLLED
ncbi:MAG TPA: DUF2007 domain-containing protein [Vicinamibacterales bacterium]|nr:DUF2007 domain-containing protein [Vicinamibacterales bacterium]